MQNEAQDTYAYLQNTLLQNQQLQTEVEQLNSSLATREATESQLRRANDDLYQEVE